MRRSRSVSSASGVTCPPGDEDHARPPAPGRARPASVIDLKPFHVEPLCYPGGTAPARYGDPHRRSRHARSACTNSPTTSRRDHPDGVHLIGVLRRRPSSSCPISGAPLQKARWQPRDDGLHRRLRATASGRNVVRPGAAAEGSRRVRFEGRDVMIVEDIVDTGLTLHVPAADARAPGSRAACAPPAC